MKKALTNMLMALGVMVFLYGLLWFVALVENTIV